jgi:hypothetical protein
LGPELADVLDVLGVVEHEKPTTVGLSGRECGEDGGYRGVDRLPHRELEALRELHQRDLNLRLVGGGDPPDQVVVAPVAVDELGGDLGLADATHADDRGGGHRGAGGVGESGVE